MDELRKGRSTPELYGFDRILEAKGPKRDIEGDGCSGEPRKESKGNGRA